MRAYTATHALSTGGCVGVKRAYQDGGGELGAEGVPHAVLGLLAVGVLRGDALLAVHALTGHQVLGHQGVLLAACHEDAVVPVLFHHHLWSRRSKCWGGWFCGPDTPGGESRRGV